MSRPLYPIVRRLPRRLVNGVKYHVVGRSLARNLDALAVLWATDKAPGHHGYTRWYTRHLGERRRSIRRLLEIGVGGSDDPHQGGNSLYMWKNYFPAANVYGLDIYQKQLSGVPRVMSLKADQAEAAELQAVADLCGPFDVVIDDGSHIGGHINTSFHVLFPALVPGGWYVIEDLETSYMSEYDGGPPGAPGTGVMLAKSLLDDVNVGPRPVASVHVYHGIAFIEKGPGSDRR